MQQVKKPEQVSRGFSQLYALMKGDARKLSLVARAFYHSVLMDLERMEQAAEKENWIEVRRLAQRIAIDCDQVSEHRGGQAMASLSRLLDAGSMRSEYQRYRPDLAELSAWSAAFSKQYTLALAVPKGVERRKVA